jgi:hypothetical protein
MTGSSISGGSPFIPRLAEIIQAETFTAHEKLFRLRFKDGSTLNQRRQFVQVSIQNWEVPYFGISPATRETGLNCSRVGA